MERMDNIKQHMELTSEVEGEIRLAQVKEILDRHRDGILEGYRELGQELTSVLDKHLPGIIARDMGIDRDAAVFEKREVLPTSTLFKLLTSNFLAARIDATVSEWIIKKADELTEADKEGKA